MPQKGQRAGWGLLHREMIQGGIKRFNIPEDGAKEGAKHADN